MACGNGWHREKRSGTLAKSAVSTPAGMKKDLDTALSTYVDLSPLDSVPVRKTRRHS
jgi:hypothetical protein